MTENIIELNRDLESAVIQGSYGRSMFFKDKYKNLQFVHFADVHYVPKAWERITEYINHYSDYISFAIHTGDYCGGTQKNYTNFYEKCSPCKRPILNCVGNHDTFIFDKDGKNLYMPKDIAHSLLFTHTDNWDVNFLDIPYSMSYYKDFPESNIRLIVLDLYYDAKAQCEWLTKLLDESIANGYHVITAMHETSANIVKYEDTPFNSLLEANSEYLKLHPPFPKQPFEEIIVDFKKRGGIHIANIAGHLHHDLFGYTEGGVLNITVECATNWHHWCEGQRVEGTRTFDAFNVMSVNVNLGILTLVRIGDNYDCYLRNKSVLCYDYINHRLIK